MKEIVKGNHQAGSKSHFEIYDEDMRMVEAWEIKGAAKSFNETEIW